MYRMMNKYASLMNWIKVKISNLKIAVSINPMPPLWEQPNKQRWRCMYRFPPNSTGIQKAYKVYVKINV